jgi:hypothetical protein
VADDFSPSSVGDELLAPADSISLYQKQSGRTKREKFFTTSGPASSYDKNAAI